MSKINLLLTLLSLDALLVILERISPTTRIILQPYSYMRVHEVFQMSVVIAISIVISFLLLKVISNNFAALRTKSGTILGTIFMLGIYFTATGNGLHEVASFLYNTFCNIKATGTGICGASFFDDYYFGNIVYFVGLLFSNLALILLELRSPLSKSDTKQTIISIANGVLYALTLFAYAAFDRVLVGLWFVTIMAVLVVFVVIVNNLAKRDLASLGKRLTLTPFTLYSLTAYCLSTILTAIIRFK